MLSIWFFAGALTLACRPVLLPFGASQWFARHQPPLLTTFTQPSGGDCG